jgi:hypothetical protein
MRKITKSTRRTVLCLEQFFCEVFTAHSQMLADTYGRARQLDSDNARIIKASIEFGIWENGNNSMRTRFPSQAARQSRARVKKAEAAKSEGKSEGPTWGCRAA